MKPICLPCHRFFRPKQNGYYFIEGMPRGRHACPACKDSPIAGTVWLKQSLDDGFGEQVPCDACGGTGEVAGDIEPGLAEPENWHPYKIWCGDVWECQGCGAQIISGVGAGPVDEHYKDGFKERVKQLGADQYQVNDC